MATKQEFTIRPAVPEDAATIAIIGARVFSATFGHSVTEWQLQEYLDEEYSQEAIIADLEDPDKDIIVVTELGVGRLVGFVQLRRGSSEPCVENVPATIELQRLYVDLTYHGNGVGKVLMQEAERVARNMGFRNMWLGVWEENHKAQAVYRKLGYEKVGDHDFVVGGDVQRDEILVKALS